MCGAEQDGGRVRNDCFSSGKILKKIIEDNRKDLDILQGYFLCGRCSSRVFKVDFKKA